MLFLAEFYLPAGSSLAKVAERARAGAMQAAGPGADVALLEVIFLPQDESCFALYRASCAADVTEAGSLAGLAFDRVTGAIVSHGPGRRDGNAEIRTSDGEPGGWLGSGRSAQAGGELGS